MLPRPQLQHHSAAAHLTQGTRPVMSLAQAGLWVAAACGALRQGQPWATVRLQPLATVSCFSGSS